MFPDALSSPQSIKLSVPEGTPLQVALVDETRVKKVGQPIRAIVVGPVYAFDRLVVPVGSQVTGQVTKSRRSPAASAQSLRWTQTLALNGR
jgi:hypothetical protein